jgi:hypothetical protein
MPGFYRWRVYAVRKMAGKKILKRFKAAPDGRAAARAAHLIHNRHGGVIIPLPQTHHPCGA